MKKSITIIQVELPEDEDKCDTCILNKIQDCKQTRSWLICTHGFMACELGYNYQLDTKQR